MITICTYMLLNVVVFFFFAFPLISVQSFCEMSRYLLHIPQVKSVLSNRLCCQDLQEQFFGKQCQQGGTNDNPNVRQFEYNTSALRVINSVALAPVHGNCGRFKRKERPGDLAVDKENTPIPKQPRNSASTSRTQQPYSACQPVPSFCSCANTLVRAVFATAYTLQHRHDF